MKIRLSKFLYLFLIMSHSVFAIEPVYEGEDGIRAQVFATNCLACHSSELSGAQRNGAPSAVNYDTFSAASEKADRAVARAVELLTMPPSFSSLPKLNQEQQDAMLAWQQAGFPSGNQTNNASFDFANQVLTLPVVNVGDSTYKATLKLIPLSGSPLGFGFVLETASLTEETSTAAATFNAETGLVEITEIDLLNSADSSNKVNAQMALIPGTTPFQFEVTSLVFIN